MQAIMESAFSVVYLITVIMLGIYILRNHGGNLQYKLFGIMAIILGCGDAFHLVPRVIALNTSGLENYAAALGFGKLITSITMTVFYVMLYHIWRMRYSVKGRTEVTISVYSFAIARVALCLASQNQWLSADAPLSWGIYRNIPFVILGLLIILVYYQSTKENNDRAFRFLWLAVALSFAFYIPVVLWADVNPIIGMLMLPKTCAYVWIVTMGFGEVRRSVKATAA